MKNILIPVDFSDNSWSSIVYAVKLFKDQLCKFYLLHTEVLDPEAIATLNDHYLKSIMNDANHELKEIKQQIEACNHNANHEFITVLKFQQLTEAIKDEIEDKKIDLILMSTKGATNRLSTFFGTNTVNTVAKHFKCPILIIPEEYDYKPIKQIVFPTDLNRFYTTDQLTVLNDISYDNNATLRVMHVKTETELNSIQHYNLSVLKTSLQGFKTHYHSVPSYDKKTEVINTFIDDLQIDLLVMVNYKHSILEQIIKEPVIKKIGFNPHVPFLILPNINNQ
ncbi:universal stress protein [Mesoflavibacter profundi]|uniref:Universal stress protein n=1 Tax=Mesoflavibacter profundi TaxID=2708110 RepID=A0ABT4RX02_9FLAO|nr:universal stress protein [Mesoflavibacter profundi]MDA0176343.1 universal stress protein [Mesoflavibacter profundi]